ncbi:MAG TPA: tetratricopeptide repeat protein [Chthoniobacterales bacterium]
MISEAANQRRLPQVLPSIGLFLLLGVTIAVAYMRVRHAGFIWDDEQHLTQNPVIVGPLGLSDIWTSARAVYYPLVLTTFWILHRFVGLNPAPYHLLNVVLHTIAAMLLWRVLAQLRVRGAWLGAAIWALHPVLVQSVAWITELKNTQSAVFYLLAISLFLQSRQSRAPGVFYWLSVASFAAAITSKPSTVILPAVLALCLWWREGKFRWSDLRSLAPFLVISLIAGAWTVWEQKYHAHAIGPEWVQTPLQRILISADAIWFYLLKLIWPHPLIFIYPRWNVDSSRPLAYVPLAALALIAIFLFFTRNGRLRPVFFAFAYFVIALFPILDFFDVYFFRYSFVSDHFQYLASMGPLALFGSILWLTADRFSNKKTVARLSIAAAVLLVLGSISAYQTGKYLDPVTLYQTTLKQNPRCWMADYNLAIALRERGQVDDAIVHYKNAIATRPEYADAHFNLARLLVEKGDADGALEHYRRAITLRPTEADAHNNYGSALLQVGRIDDAKREYETAIALEPDYADAHLNLAALSLQGGRVAEAIAQLETAKNVAPHDATVRTSLGNALMKSGRVREAIVEFNQALAIKPDEIGPLNSLAWILATSADSAARDGARAVQLAERANQMASNPDPVILHTLAAAYAEAGRFDEALITARRGMREANKDGNSAVYDALRDELPLYELGLPYHQAAVH